MQQEGGELLYCTFKYFSPVFAKYKMNNKYLKSKQEIYMETMILRGNLLGLIEGKTTTTWDFKIL